MLGLLGTAPQPVNPFLRDAPKPFDSDVDYVEQWAEKQIKSDCVNGFILNTVLFRLRKDFKYETTLQHPNFNNGERIILSYAADAESAIMMHEAQTIYFREHPDTKMIYDICDKTWYRREPNE